MKSWSIEQNILEVSELVCKYRKISENEKLSTESIRTNQTVLKSALLWKVVCFLLVLWIKAQPEGQEGNEKIKPQNHETSSVKQVEAARRRRHARLPEDLGHLCLLTTWQRQKQSDEFWRVEGNAVRSVSSKFTANIWKSNRGMKG